MKLSLQNERRGEQGGAMVEFAILMIVFVPLLTYSFYLGDVGHHILDLQETVISATWDYTSRTAESDPSNAKSSSDKLDNVYHANRFEYLDHTSSWDDFGNLNSSSDEKKYHYELGSKAAWIRGRDLPAGKGQDLGKGGVDYSGYPGDYATNSSRQLTCASDDTSDTDVFNFGLSLGSFNPAVDFGKSEYARGGIAVCWAKLEVYNYVIPEKFLHGQFANEDASKYKLEARSTDVENLTDQGGGSDNTLLLKDHAAVSFGTWAITDAGDVSYCPKRTNSFYIREAWMFAGGTLANFTDPIHISYANVEGRIMNFASKAHQDLENVNFMAADPSMFDGSPLGVGCPASGEAEAAIGAQASPGSAELVARYKAGSATGIENNNPFGPAPAGLLDAPPFGFGIKYESSPGNNGNKTFRQAYNSRGPYYMGNKSDKG